MNVKVPAASAIPAAAATPKAAFVAPELRRLGALKDLTKAFPGNGTDAIIAGRSLN